MLNFAAKVSYAAETDETITLGFAADDAGDTESLIIEVGLAPSEQDVTLGHDQPCFIVGPDQLVQYGGISDYAISEREICLNFQKGTLIGDSFEQVCINLDNIGSEAADTIDVLRSVLSR